MDLIEQLKAQLMAVTDQRDLLNSKYVQEKVQGRM